MSLYTCELCSRSCIAATERVQPTMKPEQMLRCCQPARNPFRILTRERSAFSPAIPFNRRTTLDCHYGCTLPALRLRSRVANLLHCLNGSVALREIFTSVRRRYSTVLSAQLQLPLDYLLQVCANYENRLPVFLVLS